MSLSAFGVALAALSHCTDGVWHCSPACVLLLLCQGVAAPAPLPADFHVKAKVKQQWNRCNSAVASNMFHHLNNAVVGGIPFVYCAGR